MLCEDCTKGFQLTAQAEGSIQPDGSYFHPRPTESTAPATSAVVLLTDIFGLELNNPKVIADEISKAVGVDVWVPDLFNGKPPLKEEELKPVLPAVPGVKLSFWTKVTFFAGMLPKIPAMYAVRSKVVDAFVTDFVAKIKKDRGYTSVAAVGYCFGGSICVRLASTDVFNGVVIAHPGGAPVPAVSAIKVPTLWICAEEDHGLPPAARKAAEATLASRKPNGPVYEFVDYEGTTHGFAARPALEHPKVKAAFEQSFSKIVNFFENIVGRETVALSS